MDHDVFCAGHSQSHWWLLWFGVPTFSWVIHCHCQDYHVAPVNSASFHCLVLKYSSEYPSGFIILIMTFCYIDRRLLLSASINSISCFDSRTSWCFFCLNWWATQSRSTVHSEIVLCLWEINGFYLNSFPKLSLVKTSCHARESKAIYPLFIKQHFKIASFEPYWGNHYHYCLFFCTELYGFNQYVSPFWV